MASPQREEHAEALYAKLVAMPFSNVTVVYDNGSGEWDTGKRAWATHTDSDFLCVAQDDAIIGHSFYQNVVQALTNVPEHTIVSFYTGTVRPKPVEVARSVQYAKDNDISWLTDSTLHWGVCFAMPTQLIDTVMKSADTNERSKVLNYDNRIGWYFKMRNRKVYYSMPSLVDHNDDLPSLTGHDLSVEQRVAHWFVGDEVVEFNKEVREIQ